MVVEQYLVVVIIPVIQPMYLMIVAYVEVGKMMEMLIVMVNFVKQVVPMKMNVVYAAVMEVPAVIIPVLERFLTVLGLEFVVVMRDKTV